MARMPTRPLAVGAAVFALALGAGAGCGGDDDGGSSLAVTAVNPPTGDPDLDRGSGTHVYDRVAVTPGGRPAVVYALKLKDLKPGAWVGGRSSLTVTKCAHTDYDPTARAATGCVGTKKYFYDPVTVSTQLKLVPDKGGKPDVSASGVVLQAPQAMKCTTALHHCVPANEGDVVLSSDDVSEAGTDLWLILSLEATSPKAAACPAGAKPSRCNVLAVESQKYTAMYAGVDADGTPQPTQTLSDSSVNTSKLPTVDDNDPRGNARKVVYSVELASRSDLSSLLGDVMRVTGTLVVDESEDLAPLVSSYVVLAKSPTATTGRYLSSDTYDENRTGDTGENCTGKCTFDKPVAATAIAQCDVSAGRRYVNLVADSVRDAAKPGESVDVTASGGGLEVEIYDTSGQTKRGDC